jgi:hypothetical protein
MVRFKSFDIVAKVTGAHRRIAKVKFNHDGSIYVFFPSFEKTEGVVCRASLRAGQTGQTTLDLTENGRVTAHLVKYAHHPDGEAHFSQDGKVKTEVRRKSVPLIKQRGHLFTIQAQNIDSFRMLPTPRREQLTLELPESMRALKITGWRFHLSDLKLPEGVVPTEPSKGIQTSDGVVRVGLFVAPPEGETFDDVVLFLAIEETTLLSEDKAPHLIFLGGFDPTAIVLNHTVNTEFLAFAYPCSDFEQLKERIGCIDLTVSPGRNNQRALRRMS